jgi:putative copper resistance protein D
LDEPLVWVRTLHFAATISVAGALLFLTFIAEPAFRKTDDGGKIPALVRSRLTWIEWTGLALAVLSGAAWLVLKAAQMGDVPWSAVFSEDILPMVLSGTDFGRDCIARAVLAALLGAALIAARPACACYRAGLVAACIFSAALVGTLAWAGHAAATSNGLGAAHIASDILHLAAAAAWVGALLPLAVLLGAALACADPPSIDIAREAVLRFSVLGVVSVGTLAATGIINTWAIVGSLTALAGTEYGRLLLAKVSLFFAMLSLAAVNRFRLTPFVRQKRDAGATRTALRRICTNSLIEASIGFIVVAVVGLLGTMSPSE